MPRWRPARLLQLSDLDGELAHLAERLREHRGHPEDELLLWCHIDMLLDERLSRWPGAAPMQWQPAGAPT
jgi:hypothetical protein